MFFHKKQQFRITINFNNTSQFNDNEYNKVEELFIEYFSQNPIQKADFSGFGLGSGARGFRFGFDDEKPYVEVSITFEKKIIIKAINIDKLTNEISSNLSIEKERVFVELNTQLDLENKLKTLKK
jgi:hypothetical protein